MDFLKQKDKRIGVFGLGVTGFSVYKSLVSAAKELIVYDDSQINRNAFAKEYGNGSLIPLDNKKWSKLDKIVVSPGVLPTHFIFQLAANNQIPITSDIELLIEENPKSDYVFITGTNGKSTVTALIGHILSESGFDYHIGGNIGRAVAELPSNSKGYILELSSFQIDLLNISKLSPKISVITNIMPDHLDRYNTLENYANSKEKILTKKALKIIGVNTPTSKNIYNNFNKADNARLIPVSTSEPIKGGIFFHKDSLKDSTQDKAGSYSLPALTNLSGIHNKENIGIAYAVCKALSVSESMIIEALKTFKGLPHRMEYVDSYKNIAFYNDSKATNISSALASLSSFQNIIWFAGGKFKEKSFEPLLPVLKNIKKAYFFGESKDLFADFFRGYARENYKICLDLEEAFSEAVNSFSKEEERAVFLLAPACASYDQFKSFEERGETFVKMVKNFITKKDD